MTELLANHPDKQDDPQKDALYIEVVNEQIQWARGCGRDDALAGKSPQEFYDNEPGRAYQESYDMTLRELEDKKG